MSSNAKPSALSKLQRPTIYDTGYDWEALVKSKAFYGKLEKAVDLFADIGEILDNDYFKDPKFVKAIAWSGGKSLQSGCFLSFAFPCIDMSTKPKGFWNVVHGCRDFKEGYGGKADTEEVAKAYPKLTGCIPSQNFDTEAEKSKVAEVAQMICEAWNTDFDGIKEFIIAEDKRSAEHSFEYHAVGWMHYVIGKHLGIGRGGTTTWFKEQVRASSNGFSTLFSEGRAKQSMREGGAGYAILFAVAEDFMVAKNLDFPSFMCLVSSDGDVKVGGVAVDSDKKKELFKDLHARMGREGYSGNLNKMRSKLRNTFSTEFVAQVDKRSVHRTIEETIEWVAKKLQEPEAKVLLTIYSKAYFLWTSAKLDAHQDQRSVEAWSNILHQNKADISKMANGEEIETRPRNTRMKRSGSPTAGHSEPKRIRNA